jgi:hypothetical protein
MSHKIEASIMIVPIIKTRSAFNQCNILTITPKVLTRKPSSNKTNGHLKRYTEFFIVNLNKGYPGKQRNFLHQNKRNAP